MTYIVLPAEAPVMRSSSIGFISDDARQLL